MSALLVSFATKHFEAIFTKLNEDNQREFLKMLMAVVHSHRHNKEDHVAADNSSSTSRKMSEVNEEQLLLDRDSTHENGGAASVDFTIVRDTMYKYSKQAQRRFFESPALAFLFAWFAVGGEGLRFTETKYKEKGNEYLDRIFSEINELKG